MQIIIEIDEAYYKKVIYEVRHGYSKDFIPFKIIANGTPLPKGHGRLIDANEIVFENADFDTYGDYCRAFDAIDYAETIVEADKEGEDADIFNN